MRKLQSHSLGDATLSSSGWLINSNIVVITLSEVKRTARRCSRKLCFIRLVQGWMCRVNAVLQLLYKRCKTPAQGQLRAPLINGMCCVEKPLCNAIKQVYRAPLPTSLLPTSHLYDKMPSGWSEHNSGPVDSSRITTLGEESEVTGNGR